MSESNIPTQELEQLLERLREASTRADERAKVTHARFNVFTTLLPAHDEVRLHTRFLHCLLNPAEGSHDCGARFLNLFFATLKEQPPGVKNDNDENVLLNLPKADESWTVENEVRFEGVGQIDILLKRPGYGIAIENKIYAYEQELQIKRYSDFLSSQFESNALVVYLTLHGEKSVTHGGNRYIRISYASHILAWLEKCLRETHDIIPINQVLQQYRAVVSKLTGKTIESSTMKVITEYIAKNTDLIRYREQIIIALDEARASCLNYLANEISQNLKPTYDTCIFRPFDGNTDGMLEIQPPATSALKEAPFKIYFQHWEEEKVLLIGIETTIELAQTHQRLFTEMKDKLSAQGYNTDRTLKTWPIGWHNLINPFDDAVIATIRKTSFANTASKLITDIQSYIQALERAYKDARSVIPLSE